MQIRAKKYEVYKNRMEENREEMSYPAYSVLMSVYGKDKPEYLETSIESMLSQSVPAEEYIIVVDGPVPEEIRTVISKYEERKELFTVIWLEENKGLGNALNVGLNVSRNEFIARMDADDISLPKRCERELQMFEKHEDLAICGCNIDEFYGTPDNVHSSRVVPESYEEIRKFMRRRQPFNHPTVIYRKSKVMNLDGYKPLKRKEDFDLFSRMLSCGCRAANIGESLYLYRADESNYERRKSWDNFRSAIYVYWQHLTRKGCSVVDFIIICCAEFIFLILPQEVMKRVSDKLLRKRPNEKAMADNN